jgi:hypothetical protein
LNTETIRALKLLSEPYWSDCSLSGSRTPL